MKYVLLSVLSFALLGVSACADGTGASRQKPAAEFPEPAPSAPEPEVEALDLVAPAEGVHTPPRQETFLPPTGRNSLEIVGSGRANLSFLGGAQLQVRYLDANGEEIRGGEVSFSFEGPAEDLVLEDTLVRTDRNGIAQTQVSSGRVAGSFTVSAQAELADPVIFTLNVAPKELF